jgi:3-hydroxyacyl-[acyl-carrier-protein] dehydratase
MDQDMTDFQIKLPLDVEQIQQLLPHRYPFLLVDRVTEFEAHKRVVAYKNVSANEGFFNGHFPGHPVMPGVLVLEALAQAGGVLTQLSHRVDNAGALAEGKIYYLVKIDGAKFSRMVVPGDRLDLEVSLKRTIRNMAVFTAVARVDGQQVACAEILCAEVDRDAA